MSDAEPAYNYFGVEIREPLVIEANRLASEAGRTNLHYSFCNAMLWTDRLLAGLPLGILKAVTIQFPDPWFKKRHAKRRMVNEEMVAALSGSLAEDGRVFVQTDIEFLAEEMFGYFLSNGRFREDEVGVNPFPIKTEREKAVEDKGLPVYRSSFRLL